MGLRSPSSRAARPGTGRHLGSSWRAGRSTYGVLRSTSPNDRCAICARRSSTRSVSAPTFTCLPGTSRKFTVARSVLRHLLSHYLDVGPHSLRLHAGSHGKLTVDVAQGSPVHFNVSHSGEVAVMAFARDIEVGVDVELRRDDVDQAALARRAFSSTERAALKAVASSERVGAFYAAWTCKEAFIKAIGLGLSYSAF